MPYKKASRQTLLPAISEPHNDPELPLDACPTCGRRYDDPPISAPCTPAMSTALDWVEVLHEDLHSLKHAPEEVVL